MSPKATKKLHVLKGLIDSLENYQPVYTDNHETKRLRNIAKLMSEDIVYCIEDIIKSGAASDTD